MLVVYGEFEVQETFFRHSMRISMRVKHSNLMILELKLDEFFAPQRHEARERAVLG